MASCVCVSKEGYGFITQQNIYLLWWDVKRHCSQIHFHKGISAWQNEENSCGQKEKRNHELSV